MKHEGSRGVVCSYRRTLALADDQSDRKVMTSSDSDKYKTLLMGSTRDMPP